MRQRVLRNKEQINEENKQYIVPEPKTKKGNWHSLFADTFSESAVNSCAEDKGQDTLECYKQKKLFIEIGSGKGQFISNMALVHPENLYLACEGAINIYPRILQKAGALKIRNLMLINEYIIDPSDYFDSGELAGVYLNFSDPWPKTRDAHRRLTYVGKLNQYKEIMLPGTTLEFKTDNNDLFDFSLEQVKLAGLELDRLTRDLHASEYASENIETEYEQKFAAEGKKINYFKIVF